MLSIPGLPRGAFPEVRPSRLQYFNTPRDTGDVRIRRPVDISGTTVSLLLHLSFSGTVERHANSKPVQRDPGYCCKEGNVDDCRLVNC